MTPSPTPATSSADPSQSGSPAQERATWWWDCAPVVLVLILWLVSPGAARPLANPDEGRYAAIPQEMVASGDWVTPRLNGVKYFEKPPLMYWIEAAMIKAGGTSERALRVPVALFALAGVLATYFSARVCLGRTPARIAAWVLTTSLFYWAISGLLILDMAVSALMTATLGCFIAGVNLPAGRRRRLWFYGLYASAALATLAKGLIGFLVPGAIIFLWLLLYRQWRRLRPFYLPTGTALFLAVAAPWHVLVAQRNPEWAWFYFVHEHWLRFTSTIHERAEPWWYYLPILVIGLVPWIGFLPAALWNAVARRNDDATVKATSGFFVLWAGFIFVFFSAAGSKLAPYVLPAFPALAVLIGQAWPSPGRVTSRLWPWGWGVAGATIGGFALTLAVIAAVPSLVHRISLQDERPWLLLGAVTLGAGAVLLARAAWRSEHRRAAWLAGGSAVVLYLVATSVIAPKIDFNGTKEFVRVIQAHAGSGDQVYQFDCILQDYLYYAGRNVGLVDARTELELDLDPAARDSGRFIDGAELQRQWTGPNRIWVMLYRRDLPELQSRGIETFHVCAETPRLLLLTNHASETHADEHAH